MGHLTGHLIVIFILLSSSSSFAQDKNSPAEIPASFGPFQKIPLSQEANAWAVQVISSGGFAGKGRGNLTITSQGRLFWNWVEKECNVKLGDEVMQDLTQAAFSADTTRWSGTTDRRCMDCFMYAIVLQRRESDGSERTYIAYWDDSTAKKLPDELKKLYETFMAHKECKQ